MEIIYADQGLSQKHKNQLVIDRDPHADPKFGFPSTYRVHRDIAKILEETYICFNFFRYLEDVYQELGRPLEVLEGGCGYGVALRDLKSGVTGLGELSRMPYKELRWTEQGSWYFERYTGDSFPGLGTKIRTTGMSLCREHAEVAAGVREQNRIDEFIIGAIGQYPFNRRYDYIVDSYGAAFYFPEEAIPVYGKILTPDGIVFMKLDVYSEEERRKLTALIENNNLEVVANRGSGSYTDFICKGTGLPLLCRTQHSEIIAVINRIKYTSPYYYFKDPRPY